MKRNVDFTTRIVKVNQNRYDLEVNLGMSVLSSLSERDLLLLIEHLRKMIDANAVVGTERVYYFPTTREE